ncbi:hypothetical protein MKX03_001095 [Papaver bracteatum]|nr:hypothetical protein MKX03_001095 [Papaver bracteatum]
MKLLPQHQNSFNFSTTLFLLCNITLIISYISMDVNCLASSINGDNKSSDGLALLAFKNEITQDPLGVLRSWNNINKSFHFCEWRGVTCSRRHHSRVTMIDLRSQKLVGSISPHIGNLSFLKVLYLHNNNLNGKIPQQIGRLFRLTHLGLTNNSLEGEIPHNISRCSKLISISFSGNNLAGSIPTGLGSLPNLQMIWLSYNNLSGEIPASLGNLSSTLTHLALFYNNLEGRIPNSLSRLTNLKLLVLDANWLTGAVPSSLYNISSLEEFSLMNNQLHGSIPFHIGSTLPNLTYLSLSGNYFTGNIPSSLSNMSRLIHLQLQINNLVGSVPNLGNLLSLEKLSLDRNKLGSAQPNDLNFVNSLVNCTNLRALSLGTNSFGGVLPNSIANLTTNLVELDLSENQIYGSIPIGIQNLQGLTNLILYSNQLTGSIPPGIGLLQNLGLLALHSNELSGPIPFSFGNLTRLIRLFLYENSLTGLVPSSLENCKFLQVVHLQTNRLTGSIPKQFFELPSLSISLALSDNLFTGALPTEVGKLKDLGKLYLQRNRLSGEIPSSIGECLSLTKLGLDGNFFQGNIPSAITSLKGLESLGLSHNNLSGIIPKGLENLTTLSELDLSYNNLEGAVPKQGVFGNASKFSVERNSKLCGGIPVLKLPDCSAGLNPNSKKQKHKKSMPAKVIIIIIVVVLFLALIVIFVTIYRRKLSKIKLPSTALDTGIRFKGVSYNDLLKATNGFNDFTNFLGAGSFGSVYKGTFPQDESKPVAVKVLNLQQKGATKSFMAECDALRKIRHRNLLKIVTCCSSIDFQGNPFKALVFEFMANGSLENWLHPSASDTNNDNQLPLKNLDLERRLSIAVDVASALNYLHHDSQSAIVHCDLKPSNVLLDDDLTAHVGDFGLAKFLTSPSSNSRQLNQQDASSIAIKGSIGYVSPEYGMGGEVSTQGDVYSYGILLLEMFTGKRPTDDMFKDGLNIHSLCKMHVFPEHVVEIIDSRLGVHLDDNTRDPMRKILASMIQIGVKCSSELPSDRSSMNEVVVDVQAVKNQFMVLECNQ